MPTEIQVAHKKDFESTKSIAVEVEGKKIALFHIDEEYYAIDDECSHAGGSLSEGDVSGQTVMCPLHGAEFDIKSGQAVSEPAEEGVRSYKVIIHGDNIKIEI